MIKLKDILNEGKIKNRKRLGDYTISKMEEQIALRKIISHWGKIFGDEIGKTIKKIRDIRRGDLNLSDIIDYEAKIRGRTMLFAIRKDEDGVIVAKMEKNNYIPLHSWIPVDTIQKIRENSTKIDNDKLLKDKENIQHALNFLLKIVIPDVVEYYNDIVEYFNNNPDEKKYSSYFRAMRNYAEKRFGITKFELKKTTVKEISKNLKRVVPTGKFLIQFESVINGGMSFEFYINYSETNGWVVGFQDYNTRKEWNIKEWFLKHQYFNDSPTTIIENSTNDPQSYGEYQGLTKIEEQYAYNYLIKHILPQAIQDTYYKFINKYPDRCPERKYPRISVKDISKNIKKIRTDFDRVIYESVINDHVSFNFMIVKEWHMTDYINGKEIWNLCLIIGVEGPMGDDWKWYLIKNKPTRISENISNSRRLTKMDEMYALEFLRKKLLPYIVSSINYTSLNYTGEPQILLKDFVRNLKKMKLLWGDDNNMARYRTINPNNGEPYEFLIFKNSNNALVIRRSDDGTSVKVGE